MMVQTCGPSYSRIPRSYPPSWGRRIITWARSLRLQYCIYVLPHSSLGDRIKTLSPKKENKKPTAPNPLKTGSLKEAFLKEGFMLNPLIIHRGGRVPAANPQIKHGKEALQREQKNKEKNILFLIILLKIVIKSNLSLNAIKSKQEKFSAFRHKNQCVWEAFLLSPGRWLTPVIPAFWEADTGKSPEDRSLRPDWLTW